MRIGQTAASIAWHAATQGPGDTVHDALASLSAGDALRHCQALAGALTTAAPLVGLGDARLLTGDDLCDVPGGAAVGFFAIGGTLEHVMLAVGWGVAAGTGNARIGIGSGSGWECIDLLEALVWEHGHARTARGKWVIRYRILA